MESGLSLEETARIWMYEVTPAVWPNAWSFAGEWGAFDRDWLVRAIARDRGRWSNRPGPLGYVVYRARAHLLHATWRSLARCTGHLETCSGPTERAEDLTVLASVFFDFVPRRPDPTRTGALLSLYEQTFLSIFEPVTTESEHHAGDRRVRAALGVEAQRGSRG